MHSHQAWYGQWGWRGTPLGAGCRFRPRCGVLTQQAGAARPPPGVGWRERQPGSSSPPWGDCPHSGHPTTKLALQGAFWGLMVGLALGLARMGLELAHPMPRCGVLDLRPWLLADIHYLHFAMLLCAATGAVVVGGSLLTPPPPPARVSTAPRPPHPGPSGCVHPPNFPGWSCQCRWGAP